MPNPEEEWKGGFQEQRTIPYPTPGISPLGPDGNTQAFQLFLSSLCFMI